MANIATLSVSLVARTQQFERALDKSLKKIKKFSNNVGGTGAGGGIAGAVQRAQAPVAGLATGMLALKKLAVGGAIGLAAREVIKIASSISRADSKLDLFRAQMRELGGEDITVDKVADSANRVGIGFEQAASNITGFLLAGRRLKLTNAEVLQLNENVGILGRLGGRSGQEIGSAMTQFQQALAKGKPDAVELKSIMVGLPLVAESLAQKLGVGTEELLNLNSEGKITSEILADAVLNAERLAGEESALSKMPETVDTINNKLATATLRLLGSVNASKLWTAPIGAIAAGFDKVREGIEFLKDPLANRKAEIKALDDELKQLDEDLERKTIEDRRPGRPVTRSDSASRQLNQFLSGSAGRQARGARKASFDRAIEASPELQERIANEKDARDDRIIKILDSLTETQKEALLIIKQRKADPKFDATFG